MRSVATSARQCVFLLLLVGSCHAQLLAPLMSLAGGLASNLNPFQGIASSLTGGVGSGVRGGGLLSSLRGAASTGIGFSALPGGGMRNMGVAPPVAAPALPPFPAFGASSNMNYGQQIPMLTPEELAEIMHSQSQVHPAGMEPYPNHPLPPQSQPVGRPGHQQQANRYNGPPAPPPAYTNNQPSYSQPQPPPVRPQNNYNGNRDNDYGGNTGDDDGYEEDNRGNEDSEPSDYNAARPPVRRPEPFNAQPYPGNDRYRAAPHANEESPVVERDRERDYNQYDSSPPRANFRAPRNENASPGYRGRNQEEREPHGVAPSNTNYNRPAANNRPEQGNRYLQGGFTPVSAAGGFDGPPERPLPHKNQGLRQNSRPQPAGRPSQHYYNSMHDQRPPRGERESSEEVYDERESYGRSPSENRQQSYGYYNRDEDVNDDSGDDYERRRRRRTNNSRY